MLKTSTQQLRYFLFSQYLADGVRITLEIILPVIIFGRLGAFSTGLTIATGALCVSVCDMPGPIDHKRNGMLYSILFVFIMSLLTGLLNQHIILLGLLIAVSSFFFTMFSVYGIRAGAVGTVALLVMILRMPDILSLQVVFTDSMLILAGGTWYMLIAILFYRLSPYRPAQRALGNSIHETAKFLLIKADLYDTRINFEDEYRKLVTQQVIVNEKQDAVRELLFKNKEILKEPSRTGRMLVLTFADTVDLYEHITATWYDYRSLRTRFAGSGILDEVSAIIKKIAQELDNIGLAIQSNSSYKKQYALMPDLEALKKMIDETEDKTNNNLVLKKILVNLRNLGKQADDLMNYFSLNVSPKEKMRNTGDYSKFVSHQEIDPVILRNNLNLESGVFRHAMRMMITCIAGFSIAKLISYGHHSYWILLTIIILLKPGFSLTKERNIQRFGGTIAGGLIGILVLYFIHDRDVLFGMIIFFMIGTYTFQRLNYIIMVIFTTPYILILLNLLGLGLLNIAEERLLDTGISCILSFLASYLLFPHWEAQHLHAYMKQVLKANINYLGKLISFFSGAKIPTLEYKLARKEVYIATANLSAAFNRMLSEPKNKQENEKLIYEFVVLNHVLSSNIASLSTEQFREDQRSYSKTIVQKLKQALTTLEDSFLNLNKNIAQELKAPPLIHFAGKEPLNDKQLNEQVSFIYKVAGDIEKLSKIIMMPA